MPKNRVQASETPLTSQAGAPTNFDLRKYWTHKVSTSTEFLGKVTFSHQPFLMGRLIRRPTARF